MKVAFFGGSFNPPHNGHLAVALLLRERFKPDKLIFSVSKNPLKSEPETSDEHRLAMTRLLADELNATGNIAEVSDWELKRNEPSYTIETLEYLEQVYPQAELLLAIGEDNFRTFSKWKRYEEILRRATLVVFERPNLNMPLDFTPPEEARIYHVPLAVDEASTELRAKLSKGLYPNGELPQAILTYIKERRLYLTYA
ncbi:MAG: nicotinate (nicotinamide) nucleotide adenylyltransferase [Chloroherpetonaceae bacterium]